MPPLLTAIGIMKALAPGAPGKLCRAGQTVVAVANLAPAGARRLSLDAASISKEDEPWFTTVMPYYLGRPPSCPPQEGLAMAIAAVEKRQGRR